MATINRLSKTRFVVLILLLASATAVSAQRAQNYGFVSPNTRNDLKLEEAIEGMKSPEESEMVKQAINLGCVVRSPVKAFRALGSWSDGAEHSVMLRVKSDEASVRYLLSRMGRDARQKSVLYFHPRASGTAVLFTLRPTRPVRNLVALANTLESAGIAFRTLVPLNGNTSIYILDMNRDLRPKVFTAARRLGARVTAEAGNAAFVGDEQVEQAKVAFEKEIKDFETKNPNLPPTCDAKKGSQ